VGGYSIFDVLVPLGPTHTALTKESRTKSHRCSPLVKFLQSVTPPPSPIAARPEVAVSDGRLPLPEATGPSGRLPRSPAPSWSVRRPSPDPRGRRGPHLPRLKVVVPGRQVCPAPRSEPLLLFPRRTQIPDIQLINNHVCAGMELICSVWSGVRTHQGIKPRVLKQSSTGVLHYGRTTINTKKPTRIHARVNKWKASAKSKLMTAALHSW
jgi:hypothetical protein